MSVHIALLRGINVGGHNRLPMAELAALCEDAGCGDAQTYIQSGNVLFDADARRSERIATAIHARIAERFGYDIPVVVRAAEEIATALAANPYEVVAGEEKRIHIGFLRDAPTDEGLASLDPHRSPPDEFTVIGRDIYLHFAGNMARSRLTNAYFDKQLGTVSTWRNWNTVNKLLQLAAGR